MAEKKRGPGRPKGSKNKKGKSGSSSAGKSTAGRKTMSVPKANGGSAENGSRSSKQQDKKNNETKTQERVKKEVTGIVLLALGGFFAVSMHTSLCGVIGDWVSNIFTGLFGYGGFVIPYMLIVYAILIFVNMTPTLGVRTVVLLVGLFLSLDLVITAHMVPDMEYGILGIRDVFREGTVLKSGGVFGMYIGSLIYKGIGLYGLYAFAVVAAAVCLLLLVNTPISRFFELGREKKQARKERRAEKLLQEEEEALRKKEMEEEAEKKREAMASAGRKEKDYRAPSERAADFTGETGENPSGSGEKKAGAAEEPWRTRPIDNRNKNNILAAMTNSSILNSSSENEELALGETEDEVVPEEEIPTSFTGEPIGAVAAVKSNVTKKPESKDKVSEGNKTTTSPGQSVAKKTGRYKLPGPELLTQPKQSPVAATAGKKEMAERLESTLQSFNVAAEVINVTQGPSVTRYEVQPEKGVKVSSIVKLENDIALNMEAKSIRIEAPIPGKPVVGIEIENASRKMVGLKEMITSQNFRNMKSKIAFAVGKDIEGNAIVGDLYKMPHLLIAGATGSGKSVCINSILMSILYKAKPDEVKLILIDPKMVELGQYNDIPHLLIPVVTDPTKAASALNWAVREMLDRYKKFAAEGVKDMSSFNRAMTSADRKDEIMPQVVIVIDELADLMMAASAQVEDAICRLAQMARAAGMHLIVATQRPSVDVITGLIKANIPSRIAFLVSSQVDSRTILDMAGAEKLAGNGDMLFNPQGTAKQPKRIQGAFVSDEEVHRVLDFVKAQGDEDKYDSEVIQQIEKGKEYEAENGGDELLVDAVELVVKAGQASTSMLQRRFRIGYNRAARIIDIMEEKGIIGPSEGSKPRQVMMTEAEMENFIEKEKEGEQLKF